MVVVGVSEASRRGSDPGDVPDHDVGAKQIEER
jgi:hypothetical protein